jgi:hypothetical protein
VRGIINGVYADYEIKLCFLNKEINEELDTQIFTTQHVFSNISSSNINELLKYQKFDIAKKYMNADARWRFYNKKPKFVVFYGRSCIGKSHHLNRIFKGKDIADADKILWTVFEKIHGVTLMEKVKEESRKLIYQGKNVADLMKIYSTNEYWTEFFDFIEKNFKSYDMGGYIDLKDKNDVCIVDFASLGAYWDAIPSNMRGCLYLIKLENTEENRKKFIAKKGFEEKIDYLDNNYREPNYFDMIKNL